MFDLSKNHFDLGELADPHFYNSTIDIKNKKKEKLISFLKKMILIRSVETKLAEKKIVILGIDGLQHQVRLF